MRILEASVDIDVTIQVAGNVRDILRVSSGKNE
jgi:hypothetical protein